MFIEGYILCIAGHLENSISTPSHGRGRKFEPCIAHQLLHIYFKESGYIFRMHSCLILTEPGLLSMGRDFALIQQYKYIDGMLKPLQ